MVPSHLWLISAVMLTDLSGHGSLETASVADDLAIADGLQVTLELAVWLPDKTLVASNKGGDPLTYVHGQQLILPSLEQSLSGMKAGEHKTIHVAPEQAFGRYDATKRLTVPRDQLPADITVGAFVRSSDGGVARVVKLEDGAAVLDLNHPLAGQNLDIEVKILSVQSVRGVFAEPALDRS